MFEASSSIQYVLSLASVLHSIQQMQDSSFMCQSLQIKHDVLFSYCFWLLQLIFPLWVGGFETKCQMDTLCGNMSMDVTPCVYLPV